MELFYDIHGVDQNSSYENDGDDMFYAELERRILVLINTADESGDHANNSTRRINSYSSRRDQRYFDWTETENPPSSVPSTISNLWRSANVNGTGVFIPHMVKAKRRNKNRTFSLPLCFLYLNHIRMVDLYTVVAELPGSSLSYLEN